MKRTSSMVYKPSTEAHELMLYAINDGDLYRTMTTPVIANMTRKAKKGTYDKEKSVDAFYHVATEASKHYNRDFGYSFTVTERFTAAVEMADYYTDEIFFEVV